MMKLEYAMLLQDLAAGPLTEGDLAVALHMAPTGVSFRLDHPENIGLVSHGSATGLYTLQPAGQALMEWYEATQARLPEVIDPPEDEARWRCKGCNAPIWHYCRCDAF